MEYKIAKNLKVGDRIGCRFCDEDAIILEIISNEMAIKKSEKLLFRLAFQSFDEKIVKYRDLNARTINIYGRCNGKYYFEDYENSLYCPIVKKNGILNISNKDLLMLWGKEDLIKYLE